MIFVKFTQEERDALNYICLDDSTKIIQYLEEEKELQRKHDLFMTAVAIIGTVSSVIAAITGIIVLVQ